MSGTLSSTTASALAPLLQTATGVASLGSTAYNLYDQYQNQQYQNKLRALAQNPTALNAYANQFTAPLNAGLTTSVANNAQAYLAQRGLSDSPQISQQVESQAIAPYIQQNQQAGYSNALQALGLGGGAIPPSLQQQNNLSALAKAFSQLNGPQQPQPVNPSPPPSAYYAMGQGLSTPSTIPDPYAGLGPEPAPLPPMDISSFYQPNYASGDDADAE